MTQGNTDRVRLLIERLKPEPICIECIADCLSLSVRQDAERPPTNLRAFPASNGKWANALSAARLKRSFAKQPFTFHPEG
jgi:hypothetical protein